MHTYYAKTNMIYTLPPEDLKITSLFKRFLFFLFKRSINESTNQSYWLFRGKSNEKRDKKKSLHKEIEKYTKLSSHTRPLLLMLFNSITL